MCESIVQKGISSDTVVYVWQMAKVYEAHQLKVLLNFYFLFSY